MNFFCYFMLCELKFKKNVIFYALFLIFMVLEIQNLSVSNRFCIEKYKNNTKKQKT